jgi:creatinine amidohydrolase
MWPKIYVAKNREMEKIAVPPAIVVAGYLPVPRHLFQRMYSVQLCSMTWEEIAEIDRAAIIVIPFGAVEQHSSHLPLGTDSMIVEGIARRLENQLPRTVCLLPTIYLGCSQHHMAFAGSLTAEIETFIDVGMQLAGSMAHHGFRRILLLNGHGGNTTKISIICEKLRYRHGPEISAVGVTYWHLIREEIKAIRETPMGGMGHACELETSILLALSPDSVRSDRMQAGGLDRGTQFVSGDMFESGCVSVTRPFDKLSPHGGLGDPKTASAEKGERILRVIVSKLVQVVTEMQSNLL